MCKCIYGNKVEKFSQGEAWNCTWYYMTVGKEHSPEHVRNN